MMHGRVNSNCDRLRGTKPISEKRDCRRSSRAEHSKSRCVAESFLLPVQLGHAGDSFHFKEVIMRRVIPRDNFSSQIAVEQIFVMTRKLFLGFRKRREVSQAPEGGQELKSKVSGIGGPFSRLS